jgi:hypothetical protein
MNETMTISSQKSPYDGLDTEEKRQAKYKELQAAYAQQVAEYKITLKDYKKEAANRLDADYKSARAVQLEQDASFDRSLIALSGGAFGISFAFINQIVPLATASNHAILFTAWILFAVCLVLALIGFRISSAIHWAQAVESRKAIDELDHNKIPTEHKHWYGTWLTKLQNWLSLVSFIGGVGCLITFVTLNF